MNVTGKNRRAISADIADTGGTADREPMVEHERAQPKFDDVFELIGKLGCGQILIYVFIIAIETNIGLCMLYVIFEMANPGWTCPIPGTARKEITDNATGISIAVTVYKSCPLNDEALRKCPNRTFVNKYDTVLTEWDLVCDRAYISKMIATMFFAAQLVGALIAGQVSDRIGRRIPILVVWLAMMILQTCLGFTGYWQIYAALRVLVGVCVGALVSVTCVLPMEQLGPKWRTLVSYRIGWHIAPMLLALFAYLCRENWRYLTFVTGSFGIIFYPFVFFLMPESVRWLVQKGKFNQAETCIRRLAKQNCKPVPEDLSFLKDIKKQDDVDSKMRQGYTYIDLFRTPKIAVRTLILLLVWATASCFSYVLNIKMSEFSGTTVYMNLVISGVAQLLVRSSVIFLINRLGRKRSFLLYVSVAGLCMIIIMILDLVGILRQYSYLVTAFALAGLSANAGTWSCNHVMTVEMYPTLMRNIGTSAGNMAARVGAMIAPQLKTLRITPYIILGCLAIISGFLVFAFLPETLGKPMPEALPPGKLNCYKRCCRWKKTMNVTDDVKEQNVEERSPTSGDGKNMLLHGPKVTTV
ncbi:organic cation transporter protein-like [Tubulanus polymorphus]|uniref:organic cation transporter protein-like n=1 Tax=Tubulanus polymorphus TaxID=672921 RepID=UPI003DA259C4